MQYFAHFQRFFIINELCEFVNMPCSVLCKKIILSVVAKKHFSTNVRKRLRKFSRARLRPQLADPYIVIQRQNRRPCILLCRGGGFFDAANAGSAHIAPANFASSKFKNTSRQYTSHF